MSAQAAEEPRIGQATRAREPSSGVEAAKARLALCRHTWRVGAIEVISSSVRIHPPSGATPTQRPRRRSTTMPGRRAAHLQACVLAIPRTTAHLAVSLDRAAADSSRTGTVKAERFGIDGLTPGELGNQPVGAADPPYRVGGCVAALPGMDRP
jgi:hypothetical protein